MKARFNTLSTLVVFCGLGGQGTLATKTMKDMGVKNVKNISGGISEWEKLKD